MLVSLLAYCCLLLLTTAHHCSPLQEAQRELQEQMHAEMRELEMQLEGLEELKTQLSGAWSGVHTANARWGRRAHHARGATGPPRSRLRRLMAQGLCRLLARGSP